MRKVIKTVEYQLDVAQEKTIGKSKRIPMRINVSGWKKSCERALFEKGADKLLLDTYYQARLLESLEIEHYPLMLEEAQRIKNEEKSK